mmetsp:Transcript_13728/g.31683  ORF Transcript_13728/g.31683 Transcript_13728/m.31683 type:complete len:719 (-) Transcript_13728:741-2897(-)
MSSNSVLPPPPPSNEDGSAENDNTGEKTSTTDAPMSLEPETGLQNLSEQAPAVNKPQFSIFLPFGLPPVTDDQDSSAQDENGAKDSNDATHVDRTPGKDINKVDSTSSEAKAAESGVEGKKTPKTGIAYACVACSRMKMRCDGNRPCSRCARVNRTCEDRKTSSGSRTPRTPSSQRKMISSDSRSPAPKEDSQNDMDLQPPPPPQELGNDEEFESESTGKSSRRVKKQVTVAGKAKLEDENSAAVNEDETQGNIPALKAFAVLLEDSSPGVKIQEGRPNMGSNESENENVNSSFNQRPRTSTPRARSHSRSRNSAARIVQFSPGGISGDKYAKLQRKMIRSDPMLRLQFRVKRSLKKVENLGKLRSADRPDEASSNKNSVSSMQSADQFVEFCLKGHLTDLRSMITSGRIKASEILPSPYCCTLLCFVLDSGLASNLSMEQTEEIAELLLDHGADPNESSTSGETLVEKVVNTGSASLLQNFVKKGARLTSPIGNSCLRKVLSDIVNIQSDSEGTEWREKKIEALLQYSTSSSSSARNSSGEKFFINDTSIFTTQADSPTCLQLCLQTKSLGCLRQLLRRGMLPDIQFHVFRDKEQTASVSYDIQTAVDLGFQESVDLLKQYGALIPPGFEESKAADVENLPEELQDAMKHWRSSEVMGDIDLLPEHARDVVVRHLEALESAAEKKKNLRRRLPHAIKAQLRHRIARRSRLCWLRAHQ